MAASTFTATLYREERRGHRRVAFVKVNVGASGANGAELNATDFGLDKITAARIGSQELTASPGTGNIPYAMLKPGTDATLGAWGLNKQGIDTVTLYCGDEVTFPETAGDFGIFYIELEGY